MLCVRGRSTQIPLWPFGVEADIGKVEIESNEYSILSQAGIKNLGICAATETFCKYRLHIVTGIAKQYLSVARKVLIQLEPDGHSLRYAGIGTIRSRAKSAA